MATKSEQTIKKSLLFKQCSLIFLDEQFALREVQQHQILQKWLIVSTKMTILKEEKFVIEKWRKWLRKNVYNWNEQELSMHFIGPIFSLIEFGTAYFGLFAQRPLSAVIDGIALHGQPDGLIAQGTQVPQLPFFCLHEFKKEKESSSDPAGQLLAAMLVAQDKNKMGLEKGEMPIYGCYIVGRYWTFVVLQGKQYAMSDSYVATKVDIWDIVKMLKGLKMLLLDEVKGI